MFCLLACSRLNLRQEPWNSFQLPTWWQRPSMWAVSCCFPSLLGRELSQEWSTGVPAYNVHLCISADTIMYLLLKRKNNFLKKFWSKIEMLHLLGIWIFFCLCVVFHICYCFSVYFVLNCGIQSLQMICVSSCTFQNCLPALVSGRSYYFF